MSKSKTAIATVAVAALGALGSGCSEGGPSAECSAAATKAQFIYQDNPAAGMEAAARESIESNVTWSDCKVAAVRRQAS